MSKILVAFCLLLALPTRVAEADLSEVRNEVWNFCQTDYCLRHYHPLNPPYFRP